MIELLIWLIVVLLIGGIAWWIIGTIPLPFPPWILQVVLGLVLLVIILAYVLPLAHVPRGLP